MLAIDFVGINAMLAGIVGFDLEDIPQ